MRQALSIKGNSACRSIVDPSGGIGYPIFCTCNQGPIKVPTRRKSKVVPGIQRIARIDRVGVNRGFGFTATGSSEHEFSGAGRIGSVRVAQHDRPLCQHDVVSKIAGSVRIGRVNAGKSQRSGAREC